MTRALFRLSYQWVVAISSVAFLSMSHAGSLVHGSTTELPAKVHKLANLHDWEGVRSTIKNSHWNPEEDFDLIAFLAFSHFETKRNFELSEYGHRVSDGPKLFASAYMLLLGGALSDARHAFSNMIRSEESSVRAAGIRGMLAYADHINDNLLLSEALSIARQSAGPDAHPVEFPLVEYEAAYLYSASRLQDLSELLQKTSSGYSSKQLNPVSFTYYKGFLHFVKNEFSKAYAGLNRHYELYGPSQDLLTFHADVIGTHRGPDSELQFLHRQVEQYPMFWDLRRMYALALIRAGSRDEGKRILEQLIEERRHDKLSIVKFLFSSDVAHLTREEVNRLVDLAKGAEESLTYNIAMSRVSLDVFKRVTDSIKYAEMAKRQAPRWLEVQYLEAETELLRGNDHNVVQVLRRILQDYPNEILARIHLADRLKKLGKLEEAKRLARETLAIPRYISRSERQRLADLVQ